MTTHKEDQVDNHRYRPYVVHGGPRMLGDPAGEYVPYHIARYWQEECLRYEERLQIDPGGSDQIDALEMAITFLRHRAETAEERLEQLEAERDKTQKWINSMVSTIYEHGPLAAVKIIHRLPRR